MLGNKENPLNVYADKDGFIHQSENPNLVLTRITGFCKVGVEVVF